MNYFLIFFQSNLLEMPIYVPFLIKKEAGAFRAITLVTGMNAITHPMVFFFIMNLKMPYLFNILCAESFAILVEGIMIKKITGEKILKCLFTSVLANFLSWQLSPMITYALH